MERLPGHSPDLVERNIERLKELFPSVVTEGVDESGRPVEKIDFDALRQELSDHVVDGPEERFQLDWPGKRQAALAANVPVAKTLRPQREESVDFDTTRNLFIEGDNLDVLKLLQESYLGKVKLIYIDPPYNTGNDFIYNDDFAESKQEYLERSGQVDEAGNRLVANTEANGRFHSDWLSMMYPRLKLARNLLTDDGVFFISIDDHEVSTLTRLCDEIFGPDNFVANFIWNHRKSSQNDIDVSLSHNYTLVYARDRTIYRLKPLEIDDTKFANPDNDPRGPWVADPFDAPNIRPNLTYAITNPDTGQEHWPPKGRHWRFTEDKYKEALADGRVVFGKSGTSRPQLKRFLTEAQGKGKPPFTIWSHVETATQATKSLMELFDGTKLFDTPKPVGLIEEILKIGSDREAVVLDFFAGSGSTAHAVMSANSADEGRRRHITVQLHEVTDPDSAAAEAGFATIAELARERIRRAGAKIVAEAGLQGQGLDVGFRALRVDSSGRTDVFATADDTSQESLDMFESNIAADRSGEDLLFQVLLEWGLELSLPIERSEVDGHEVFDVDGGALVACFDTELSDGVIEALAAKQPLRIVFRDDAFTSDAARINAEQTIHQIAPDTEVRVL